MSSEHSEMSAVMGKHTARPSRLWCKGSFTLAYCDLQIRRDIDSAAASMGFGSTCRLLTSKLRYCGQCNYCFGTRLVIQRHFLASQGGRFVLEQNSALLFQSTERNLSLTREASQTYREFLKNCHQTDRKCQKEYIHETVQLHRMSHFELWIHKMSPEQFFPERDNWHFAFRSLLDFFTGHLSLCVEKFYAGWFALVSTPHWM